MTLWHAQDMKPLHSANKPKEKDGVTKPVGYSTVHTHVLSHQAGEGGRVQCTLTPELLYTLKRSCIGRA